LLGLGVEELSASPGAIPLVKEVIRRIRYSEAQDLAEAARSMATGAEVLGQCRDLVRRVAPEILELAE
jgi:phosphoenolpyruvate-protein kinase (PTS system EI component)